MLGAIYYLGVRIYGKLYAFIQNNIDTSSYYVLKEKEITIDTDPTIVKVFADTKMVLYSYDKVVRSALQRAHMILAID